MTTQLCHRLSRFKALTLQNMFSRCSVKKLSFKNDQSKTSKSKNSKEEYIRVLPREDDFNLDEKDDHSLLFSTRINEFLKEFPANSPQTQVNKTQHKDSYVIDNMHGFSYSDETSIDNIRRKSAEKFQRKIKEVEREIIEEDELLEKQKIANIANEMEYLQSISDKFVSPDNLEATISRVLDNPISFCYALDMNGKKHHGYTQIEGQEMKSLWDGNPHPSSFESYVDTRKPTR